MALNISQNDYNIIKQRYQVRFIKVNLLDFQFRTVDEISGQLIGGSVNIDADSDLRRSCSVKLVVSGNSYTLGVGGRVWLDKYIQPYIGIQNIFTGEIQWYNMGIYLINAPNWEYDAQTNTLQFSGLDLMSKLTGVRNGQLPGIPTVIKAGENVRQVIIATLALGGFTRYAVEECTLESGEIQPVPNDINIAQGGTVYDVLSALRNILPGYQMYFDVDGVFHYDRIPSGENAPVLIDDDLWNSVLISENVNTDFENVKNYIEVYGRSHDVKNYASAVAVSGSTIDLTIASVTELTAGTMVGFTSSTAVSGNIQLNVSGLGAKNLVNGSGSNITSLESNVYYVAIYQEDDTWLFLGHQQAQATYADNNPESPFYINGTAGIIRLVLSGGEYDNIQSDELALERAKYELYLHARLQDGMSLYTTVIPWLDVNIVVSHQVTNTQTTRMFMVKTVAMDFDVTGTMTVGLVSYYPAYPTV